MTPFWLMASAFGVALLVIALAAAGEKFFGS